MRAVVITRHGPPEVLEVQERPDPPVGPGEVRIAVKAAGINFADTLARLGLYPDAPKLPCVVGYEVAGEVESVGDGVDDAQGGRPGGGRAPGSTARPSWSRSAEPDALPLPKKLSFEQGAAFPVNYATAYAALVIMGGLKQGERVLIHAAAGGVGHLRDPDRAGRSAPRSSAPHPPRSTTRSASRASTTRSTTAT